MTSLTSLLGTQVVSRASAEHLGDLHGVIVDVSLGTVTAWQVGKGRKARLVDQAHVTGIGDAVVIDTEDSLREPTEGVEEQTVKGHGALLGALVLGDDGTEHGTVDDVEIDTQTAAIGVVTTADGPVEPQRLRGLGTYALVVAAD
jgi:sporulation protein YlmC with PRC-barrel domain